MSQNNPKLPYAINFKIVMLTFPAGYVMLTFPAGYENKGSEQLRLSYFQRVH